MIDLNWTGWDRERAGCGPRVVKWDVSWPKHKVLDRLLEEASVFLSTISLFVLKHLDGFWPHLVSSCSFLLHFLVIVIPHLLPHLKLHFLPSTVLINQATC